MISANQGTGKDFCFRKGGEGERQMFLIKGGPLNGGRGGVEIFKGGLTPWRTP